MEIVWMMLVFLLDLVIVAYCTGVILDDNKKSFEKVNNKLNNFDISLSHTKIILERLNKIERDQERVFNILVKLSKKGVE